LLVGRSCFDGLLLEGKFGNGLFFWFRVVGVRAGWGDGGQRDDPASGWFGDRAAGVGQAVSQTASRPYQRKNQYNCNK
jgi:hypothetical protein